MAELRPRSQTDRNEMYKIVPLDTPFVLGIFTGDICNFKCKYCLQSVLSQSGSDFAKKSEQYHLVKKFMEWDIFETTVLQAKEFPHRIKHVLFSSMGEPLLHPQIARMVAFLNKNQVADTCEIITNASMLTRNLSKDLIDAGLRKLSISIQGVTAETYNDVCGFQINMEQLVDNIRYFYEHSRGKCHIHIKTLNIALKDSENEVFFKLFGPISDTIYIDNVIAAYEGIDYSAMVKEGTTLYQEHVQEKTAIDCCPKIFYTLYTLPDGTIAPCCDLPEPVVYGNVRETTLLDAWWGKKRMAFLGLHLDKQSKEKNSVCAQCDILKSLDFPSDNLDNYTDFIRNKWNFIKSATPLGSEE